MKVTKISLLNSGFGGVEIVCDEPVEKGGITIFHNVTRGQKLPMPKHLRDMFGDLKYYYLTLTGHWYHKWSEFLNDDMRLSDDLDFDSFSVAKREAFNHCKVLMENMEITGIVSKGNGIQLLGKMMVVEDKYMGYNTPYLTENDHMDFYEELTDKVSTISKEIVKFIKGDSLMLADSKEFLRKLFANSSDRIDAIDGMDKKMCDDEMMKELEKKGYLVIPIEEQKVLSERNDIEEAVEVRSNNSPGLGEERHSVVVEDPTEVEDIEEEFEDEDSFETDLED